MKALVNVRYLNLDYTVQINVKHSKAVDIWLFKVTGTEDFELRFYYGTSTEDDELRLL